MSTRAATMSRSYSSPTPRPGFFRKLVVTLLFVACVAGSMALFNIYQKNLSSFWMMVFAILSIGFASGVASRINFYQRPLFIRFFITLLALPLGLFVLGILTKWRMGIGPLYPWFKGNIPQDELIQLGGAFLVAVISLEAWWNPRSKMKNKPKRKSPGKEQTPVTALVQSAHPKPAQPHIGEGLKFLPKKSPRPKWQKTSKVRNHTVPRAEKLILKHSEPPIRSGRRRLFNRKPKLQISPVEEHRCPYCLDVVRRNDPRGVKECEICHSLHHADCWAITGMCQVPHLNS